MSAAGHTNGFGGNGRRATGGSVSVESPHHIPAGGLGAAGGPATDGAASDGPARSAGRAGEPVEARNIIECLLLARGGILKIGEIKKVLDIPEPEIRATLAALTVEYGGRGLQIQEVAGGYQLCTRPEYGAHVQRLLRLDELDPLTRATLEVLAIVAYRQPVTRAEVDVVRGVQSVHHLIKLQDRRLIREIGRRPGPGRPILYGTTEGFLRYFGLRDIAALPAAGNGNGTPTLPPTAP
ncbi:MAG TPA: SMC-Scp complex subunit ScpB [bacterium]|nr:SMC-Scp complex subunit ScpB [bacterium]